jgi:hypothetical protein
MHLKTTLSRQQNQTYPSWSIVLTMERESATSPAPVESYSLATPVTMLHRGSSIMRECERCGQIRPDSQTTCDCAAPEARFESRRSPGWSTVALVTTIGAEIGILSIESLASGNGFDAIGKVFLLLLVAFVGILITAVAGVVAKRRGEAWGGRIAVLGVAILVGTLLVLYAF